MRPVSSPRSLTSLKSKNRSRYWRNAPPKPMSLPKRLKLASQGLLEHAAHLTYLSAKSLLLSAAELGYGFSN